MPSRLFHHYIGIDYSGAARATTRNRSIQVFSCTPATEPQIVHSIATTRTKPRNWNRVEVLQWLVQFLKQHPSTIIGMDHGFSFPISYFEKYQLASWNDFLADFSTHWPTDAKDATVEQFRRDGNRTGDSKELRTTEKWTSSAKSVFLFDVQGSVAKSTHAGLPFLWKLRNQLPELHCWPFDGFEIPSGHSVIAEVYPSLFRNRYSKKHPTVDQQDAYSVCRWLKEMDQQLGLDRFFHPPLDEAEKSIVQLEGWILGVN